MKSKLDWRSVYFNLVSLVAIIVFLIAAISAGHGMLRIIVPKMSLNSYEWQQVESFDAFKRGGAKRSRGEPVAQSAVDDQTTEQAESTEAELRAEWDDFRSLAIEGQKRRGVWELLQSLVSVVVAVPIFWWHRRGAERARRREDETELETG